MAGLRSQFGGLTVGALLGAGLGFAFADLFALTITAHSSDAWRIFWMVSVLGGPFLGSVLGAVLEGVSKNNDAVRDRLKAICVLLAVISVLYFLFAATFRMN